MAPRRELIEVAGREVGISNPDKLYFPEAGYTKLDLVRYYLAVAEGALCGVAGRPMALKRFVDGAAGAFFFQKRAPTSRPPWIETVELSFPSGRTADEVVVRDAAQLLWVVNLGCIDLNPHPVRADDLGHPDELRVDLDPVPGVPWDHVRQVALVTREALADHGLVGWPKTSGSRGIHINVRIERRWTFPEVRRAALALARDVERRAPALATSKWWKEERHGVFLDYNQNAKDRTVASAYSVRPTPDARVSAPLAWDEVPLAELGDFTLATVPRRFEELGDPGAGIDGAAGSLESLLELSARHEAEGFGDAPWPPNYAKTFDEPPRVQPSRRRMSAKPLIEIGRAAKQAEAMEGLRRWRERHPEVWPYLEPHDVLVDAMRGRYTTWTRIRVNLERVPPELRPPQAPLDPDYDPWSGVFGDRAGKPA
ncbi:MAG TPA: DNA polymerase domain-containing protein [Candidatus Dormibacteraeota bacterium]|nr:DNA polymerase domain-containing protein [Candidatus Dormibacteraeota bacterium]